MKTVADVIERLGGVTRVSQAMRCPIGTVSAWSTRNSIPSGYWMQVEAVAEDAGAVDVSIGLLARIHASPAPASSEAA